MDCERIEGFLEVEPRIILEIIRGRIRQMAAQTKWTGDPRRV